MGCLHEIALLAATAFAKEAAAVIGAFGSQDETAEQQQERFGAAVMRVYLAAMDEAQRDLASAPVTVHRGVEAAFEALHAAALVPMVVPAPDAIAPSADFEPPEEPDPAPVEPKQPPKAPAGGAAATAARMRWEMSAATKSPRLVSITTLPNGESVLGIGDVTVRLSSAEHAALHRAFTSGRTAPVVLAAVRDLAQASGATPRSCVPQSVARPSAPDPAADSAAIPGRQSPSTACDRSGGASS